MRQSELVTANVIQEINKKIWEKVAQEKIQNMVPSHISNLNNSTFKQLLQLGADSLRLRDKMNTISDKRSLKRDNLLKNYITVQKKVKPSNQVPNSQQKSNKNLGKLRSTGMKNNSRASANKSVASSQKMKQSKQSNNFVFIKSHTEGQEEIISKSSKDLAKIKDETQRTIEILRNKLIFIEESQKKEELELKQSQKRNLQRWQGLQKKKKQIQKISFDYNGQFFGSKVPNPESSTSSVVRLKSECTPGQVRGDVSKIQPKLTKLANEKLQQRLRKLKSINNLQVENMNNYMKQSLARDLSKNFATQNDLQEGVSIKQASSNFQKKNPLKRVGQKITLTQFKKQLLSHKFKQFRLKPLVTVSSGVKNKYKNNPISYRSQQPIHQSKRQITIQSQLSLKQVKGIHNMRFKTLMSSQESFVFDQTKLSKSSKLSKINKGIIKIDNHPLYTSFCNDPQTQY